MVGKEIQRLHLRKIGNADALVRKRGNILQKRRQERTKKLRTEHLSIERKRKHALFTLSAEEIPVLDTPKLFAEVFPLRDIERAARLSCGALVNFHPAVLDEVVISESKEALHRLEKRGRNVVIGIDKDEFLAASDATPIVEYTKDVVYLEDEEVAVLTVPAKGKPKMVITNLKNVQKVPLVQKLEMSLSMLEKGGYPHFMLKEIFEQPKALRDCLSGRINTELDNVALSGVIDHKKQFLNARRIIIVGCGTSWHAGLVGEYAIEELARIPVEVEYASEFRYRDPLIFPDDVVIAISQSGETADTLAAVKLAKQKGAFVYGICNVVGSSIARATDGGSYTHAGPEIGVASTKAFTAQVCVLTLLALALAKEKKTLKPLHFERIVKALHEIPDKIEIALKKNAYIADFAKIFTYSRNFLYLGRGYNYPLALEGALKLKEISYIHAEGYPAAEMKHGPIALIDAEMPIVVIAPNKGNYEKIVSNIQEVKARKGRVISIVSEGDTEVKALSDFSIEIPETEEALVPVLACIPLQLLAYHIAVQKGCNVDQPRNLAKSVTVE